MGGRGTFAVGRNVDFTYKTVGTIEGVKILEGINYPALKVQGFMCRRCG